MPVRDSSASSQNRPESRYVTIVMYHYVRPIRGSGYERIKGLELEAFRRQLDYIEHHYTPVSMAQVIGAANEPGESLPRNPILLTFDDGYLDHYRHVFPELKARKISGAFYPTAATLLDRAVLDVNKVHFILASVENADILTTMIDDHIREASDRFELETPDAYKAVYARPSRWDNAEIVYIKRMLQHALPEALRNEIVDILFHQHVSNDIADFAENLYVNAEQLREMASGGMHIGSHGDRHYWLSRLDAETQRKDIHDALRIFDTIGMSRKGFTFCYPYGDFNRTTVDILQEMGCTAALSTKLGRADISRDMLTLARIDTNDLPR